MGLHFAEDGYQNLDLQNPNYHMLLKLFYTIESFLGTLKQCLKSLEQNKRYLIPEIITNETFFKLTIDLFWKNIEEFHDFQNAIRDRSQIDLLRARAQDDLDSDSDEEYDLN